MTDAPGRARARLTTPDPPRHDRRVPSHDHMRDHRAFRTVIMGDRAAAKLNNKFSRQNAALGAETRDAASRFRR